MKSAGYSETPLIKKLGIKPGMKLLLINPPEDYFSLVEMNLNGQLVKQNDIPDLVHLFVKNNNEFEKEMTRLRIACKKNPAIAIWVSWYKRSSNIATDLTEDVIRNYALKNDLVDVKVCAVNEMWSGLKLVVPVSKR